MYRIISHETLNEIPNHIFITSLTYMYKINAMIFNRERKGIRRSTNLECFSTPLLSKRPFFGIVIEGMF